MPLQCNIDSKGRVARLVYGLVLLAAGVAMVLTWALHSGSVFAWVASAAVLVGGAFAVVEARAGWCVVRAMGFKTRL
jgi:uncharacterized membrane protein